MEDQSIKGALTALRTAVVFEKEEKTKAPFEAKQDSDRRIEEAHHRTVRYVHEAHSAGATKTAIAEQLGIKNLNRVGQLIDEGKKLNQGEHA